MSYDRDLREWKRTQREIKMKGISCKNVAFEDRDDNELSSIAFLIAGWLMLGSVAVVILVACGS
jgi:hypothetical protein